MPPRLPLSNLSRTFRLHTSFSPLPRRPFTTVHGAPRHLAIPKKLVVSTILVTTGLYYLSRPTIAEELQSSKIHPGRESRELTASAARKSAQQSGKTEKEEHSAGGAPHHHQSERAVAEEKPESGANKDSRTGEVRGGHDESGQPKDERLRGKGGKATEGKIEEKKDEKKEEQKDEKKLEEEREEDDGPQAFDPETGEINWDCPCLGDMPHGPCGPQFRAAFSCFVHSTAEPKGQDCIDAFAEMQDCFRAHPEVYKPLDALDDDDLDETSEEALETAVNKGDEKLEQKDSSKQNQDKDIKEDHKKEKKDNGKANKKETKGHNKDESIPTTDVKPTAKGSQGGKKPKQGDEGKNENLVARSG